MKKAAMAVFISFSMFAFTQVALAGDAAAGKAKSQACVSCHGMNGKSNNPNYPNLAGQKKNYLVKAMKAYKSGERKDAMMNSLLAPMSDEDIENLAEFFSSVK
ncbi:MAG: cytochrome c [Gammaproteobacteria bacterium]